MELKEFVKKVLVDVVEAVEEARSTSSRDMHLFGNSNARTIEFDVAVTVEKSSEASGKAGIKVLELIEGGGNLSKKSIDTTVSRIQFGVYVDTVTKQESEEIQSRFREQESRGMSTI